MNYTNFINYFNPEINKYLSVIRLIRVIRTN
jgi:hypothetical protein